MRDELYRRMDVNEALRVLAGAVVPVVVRIGQRAAVRDELPLAVPVMLEIGRENVYGEASDELLAEAEAELVKEAMR